MAFLFFFFQHLPVCNPDVSAVKELLRRAFLISLHATNLFSKFPPAQSRQTEANTCVPLTALTSSQLWPFVLFSFVTIQNVRVFQKSAHTTLSPLLTACRRNHPLPGKGDDL